MAAKLPVWGIDVGQCSLKALKLQPAGDRVEMLGFDVVPHDSILSQNESEAPRMIKQALETFRGRNDLRNCLVVISVPGQQTLTRFTKMPPVEAKKIPDMVKYEAGQQIPFDMDEVVWDYQIFTEPDSPDVECGIFAIRKELIRNYLSHFTELGIEPIVVQAGPMASYNAVRYDRLEGVEDATILLDMGAVSTDLIVAEGATIWSRPLPIGGNRFTEALVSAFKINFAKAETLKRNAGATKYARQVFQAMRPVFADLVSEVQRSIGYYTSTHRESHVARVVGMGNAFKLPGLQKFLQQNLQIDLEKLGGFQKLATAGHEAKPEFADNVMSFAVAYGLALQGLELGPMESNLLPPEIRRSLLWKKKRPWFAAAAACLAGAAGAVWGSHLMAAGQLDSATGGMAAVAAQPVPTVEAAMAIVTNPPVNEPDVKFAAVVDGAVGKLNSEYDAIANQSLGPVDKLRVMAVLPDQNVIVPRIIDVIHRIVSAASPEEVRSVKSPQEYLELAARLPRERRDELWIEQLTLVFNADDPNAVFDSSRNYGGSNRPGWGVVLVGRTTKTEAQAPDWLNEKLIQPLNELGKEPARGFYLDGASIQKYYAAAAGGGDARSASPMGGGTEPAFPRGGGTRVGGGPTGRFGDTRGRVGGDVIGGGGDPFASQSRGPTARDEVDRLLYDGEHDPLTNENETSDIAFVVHVLAYKRDTPEVLIPERFKPKPEGNAGQP